MISLTELKQVIDSMESRIEDDAVDRFQQQLSIIGEQYTDSAGVTTVIKIMQSIGRYLGSKKNDADKDTVPVLNFIVIELERLVLNPDLNQEGINQILSGCIQNYNALKSQISSQPLVTSTEMQDLKAVILAVDWEISEATLKNFDTVTSRILTRLKPHKIHHSFLRIIHSIGRYIASKKAGAHKDSVFFMRSVFENFERIVQAPDMPFQEKKQLIESDITAFNKFKREAGSLKGNIPVPPEEIDKIEDEIIQPALSHIKAPARSAGEDLVPLTTLSVTPLTGDSLDSENLTPALGGRKKIEPAPRDIMDDLFSGKESPADELLDAIHLAGIHGPDQQRAMNMSDPTEEDLQRDGIKNFTPHRIENEPIAEIGNRLDEFFSLDISEDNIAAPGSENSHPLAADGENEVFEPDDSSMEAVVPFQHEEDPAQTVINRLSALVKTQGVLEENSLTAIDEDLFYLKTLWQDDPDKTLLIELTSWLTRSIKNQPEPVSTDPEPGGDETAQFVPEQLDKPPLGFWGKVKSIFSKSK